VIPQVLFFVFLALTTVVGVWRDITNGVFTLATAWNATNTLILGAFLVAVLRESHVQRYPRERLPVIEAPVEAEPITVVARPLPHHAAEPAPAPAQPAVANSTAEPASALAQPAAAGGPRRRHRQLRAMGGLS
jgi:cellulose synthase (UDP-forming)